MRTKLLMGAFVLSAALTTAQTEKKTTVRIKKTENINGVEKMSDTTYTIADSDHIILDKGIAEIKEMPGENNTSKRVVIVSNNSDLPKIILDDKDPDRITIHSNDGKEDKDITLDLKAGIPGQETMVVNIGKEMSPEEQKACEEKNAREGRKPEVLIINKNSATANSKTQSGTHHTVVFVNNVKIIDPSKTDAQQLGRSAGAADGKLAINEMDFYPNPNNGKFNLRFSLPQKGNTSISVFNAEGKVIYSEQLKDFTGAYDKEIDISQNPKGIYFVKIEQGGHTQLKKIVLD